MVPYAILLAFLCLGVACMLHYRLQQVVLLHAKQFNVNQHVLHDPLMRWARSLCNTNKYCMRVAYTRGFNFNDIIVKVLIAIMVIWLAMKRKTHHLLENSILVIAGLLVFRGILFNMTIMPAPNTIRHISTLNGGCNDLMFSGHYVIVTIFLYLLWRHMHLPILLKIACTIIGLIVMPFLTLASQSHYSIDILLSMVITYLVSSQGIG